MKWIKKKFSGIEDGSWLPWITAAITVFVIALIIFLKVRGGTV